MYSPCRRSLRRICILSVLLACASACDREQRDFRAAPPAGSPPEQLAQTGTGEGDQVSHSPFVGVYQENRWAVSEGKRLFNWYNCSGCHAPGGGGGMGPPLIDTHWLYGSAPADVFESITDGRPNGMPPFRQLLSVEERWKLVAWVRTLARLTPRDVWPARGDELAEVQRDGPRGETAPSAGEAPVRP
jgi:cytochrome c oxidase cbb3-type subunit 3